jgi:hypothetical protein
MEFVFESIFYNFDYIKSEVYLDWFYNIFTVAIDTILSYFTFINHSIFSLTIYLILVNMFFLNITLAQWI